MKPVDDNYFLSLDFETSSDIPLSSGLMNYIAHPSTKIVCLGYSLNFEEPILWTPGMGVPPELATRKKYAHNAIFDFLVWTVLGYKHGFPATTLADWVDTMALCGRYAYPLNLEDAANALKTTCKKNPRGKLLMSKICKPPYSYTRDELMDFYHYCLDDVAAMNCIIQALPAGKLSEFEQRVWLHTQALNMRGIPVDVETAEFLNRLINAYRSEVGNRLPELTGGRVTAATQIARIKKECLSHGVELPDMTASTIEEYLEREDQHPIVAELLVIRAEFGGTATNKFQTLLDQHCHERIHFNVVYHAATTGRFAGRGYQIHNLPRAKTDDPEALIEKFKNFEVENNVVLEAKKLVRAIIMAPPGKKLLVADFDSIETVLLMWLVDDMEALEILASGDKLYYHMAAHLYGLDPKKVDKKSNEYALGKALILGCGYGMGWARFQEVVKDYKLVLTEAESRMAVDSYRAKYHRVKSAWYGLKNAVEGAVRNAGMTVTAYKCLFTVKNGHLWIKLPSGRNLFYDTIKLDGDGLSHMGLNTKTFQWERRRMIPGRIMENIIQGLARDYLCHGMLDAEVSMPHVVAIGHVHDEVINEVDDEYATEETLKEYYKAITARRGWRETIPMHAAGYIGQRFKKD